MVYVKVDVAGAGGRDATDHAGTQHGLELGLRLELGLELGLGLRLVLGLVLRLAPGLGLRLALGLKWFRLRLMLLELEAEIRQTMKELSKG